MIILQNKNINLKNVCLILGFFDGIHLGHQKLITDAVQYAKINSEKTVLITFNSSPTAYFNQESEYLYSRTDNYHLIEKLGVDYLLELDFAKIVNMPAEKFLSYLSEICSPMAVFSGFNYTFGVNKSGTIKTLEDFQSKYNYKYFCIQPLKYNNIVVSSSYIKQLLKGGNISLANKLLGRTFTIESNVIKGRQIGRQIGFPTANCNYPENIVKIPYGVYAVKVLEKKAVLNWGIRPTFDILQELLEIHIPDFEKDLYGKNLSVQIIKKIRDERKFNNLEDLKKQIKKDVEECLK